MAGSAASRWSMEEEGFWQTIAKLHDRDTGRLVQDPNVRLYDIREARHGVQAEKKKFLTGQATNSMN